MSHFLRVCAAIVKYGTLNSAEGYATLAILGSAAGFLALLKFADSWLHYAAYFTLSIAVIRKVSRGPMCTLKKDLHGRVALITGANSGIGLYTALRLAEMKCTVILGCRSSARAEQAMRFIKERVPGASLYFGEVDVSSLASVRAFAKTAVSLTPLNRIDYLINNAGMLEPSCGKTTKDGLEINLGTNHYGPFLLTELLLPAIVETRGRIINIASGAHLWTPRQDTFIQHLRDVNDGKDMVINEYGTSKGCNILYAKELADRVGPAGVTAVSVHPGVVSTNVANRLSFASVIGLMSLMMKDCDHGAQTTLQCVLADDVKNGGYYLDCALHEEQLAPYARSIAIGRQLTALSRQATGLN